ncbi:MAG: 50S ribosomal protein L23 [Chloroflexota bacterium]|nr:50S ribosomal protein L23 [Chloroflexota bacterium]
MPHMYEVLRRPMMTERNTDLMQHGRYTFEVARDANKIQIKEAVETAFNVTVLAVNTLNVHRRLKREKTRYRGYSGGFKKAIVTLAPGQRIEIFEGI